jgi:O-antigen/teichoic acid export membrane protein
LLEGDKKTKIKFLLGIFLSIIISYLFFPLSNYTLLDYWEVVTAQGGSFNLVLTISRAIRFNHFIWITPVVFSVLYELFLRNQQKKGQVDYKKSFKKSIIISVTAEIILGLIGLCTYILWDKVN